MRLWSLHPKYLDTQGLVALWRETLLAQAVLRGETRGYRNHPQLDRFKDHSAPLAAIAHYLRGIHEEATQRGYAFDRSKIRPVRRSVSLIVTSGQVAYEWAHLLAKLKERNPALYREWRRIEAPAAHSVFQVRAGDVELWERRARTIIHARRMHAVASETINTNRSLSSKARSTSEFKR